MKKIASCFIILCLYSLYALAQTPSEKTLLWQVSGKGITKPSYLFGTIHLMCAGDIHVQDIVRSSFNSTKKLYLEIDMDDLSNVMSLMKMQDSSTLEKLIGEKYDTVNQVFKSLTGMTLQMMNTTKPMMVLSALLRSMLGCMPVSWEGVFQKMAKEKNIEVKGLETMEYQMNIFDSIPYQAQADILVKTIMNNDSSRQELKKMLSIYNNKDINEMSILSIVDEDLKKYEHILLNNRNKNWINIIGGQAARESTFFAFGAGHLGGSQGVIALLRKAGYKVKPVMYK